ncbi:hypothetical protein Celaphus_00007180 [Cervus elaphus hippelaphus]|uniref:Uncharacterized protein n=1 Tax=Cervus elaphus hippelaphus TaxID=46360 RepID=A0A212CYX5_CEREH|nr:hypothetical protein Celaphus_00007180 [Cervus elaphus hippelaphus]
MAQSSWSLNNGDYLTRIGPQVSEGSPALALGQGLGLFPQVPSQGLWCPVARLVLLPPIKLLPRPVLLVSAGSAASVRWCLRSEPESGLE